MSPELSGRRVAILAENLYEDLELWYPYYRLQEAGAEVAVVGPKAGEVYTSKHGLPVTASISAADAITQHFDAVVIPGGYSPDLMRRNPAMVAFVREADANGLVVAAICHAGWMLISAGIARGRRMTCFHSIRDDVIAAGASYTDEPVVRDRNLVTSRQPADLPHFCRELISAVVAETQQMKIP